MDNTTRAGYDEQVSGRKVTNPGGGAVSPAALNVGGQSESVAGGEMTTTPSNAVAAPTTRSHGAVNISDPDAPLTTQTEVPVLGVGTGQENARVGGTGFIGANGVGTQSIPYSITSNPVSISSESHNILGVNYTTKSGTTSVILNNQVVTLISSVYSSDPVSVTGESKTITGYNYNTAALSGVKAVALSNTGVISVSAVSGSTITNVVGETASITGCNYDAAAVSGVTAVSLSKTPVVLVTAVSGASGPYPLSSVDASGAGYRLSGNSLVFTNGMYPSFSGAATDGKVPQSGDTFFATYTYANAALLSTYPLSSADPNNAGYRLSGNSLVFTNGMYPAFSGAAAAGKIPLSGVAFYVTYTYSDGVYPSSSVGTNGAGWYQSGSTLMFTNGYYSTFSAASLANQIPDSGTAFYVDYIFTKVTTSNSTESADFTGTDNYGQQIVINNVANRFIR
jgi:hypothetical protein